MAAERNPWGYGTALLDPDELDRRTSPNAVPEFQRRIMAWARWSGLSIKIRPAGCGGGRRYTQPDRPGFAKPVFIDGRWWTTSFHMLQPFEDGNEYYAAWDVVIVNPGGVHRAPTWEEAATALPFGIHFPVSGEPWHAQCIEMRGWTTWYKGGRRLPDPNFRLPTAPPPVVLPPGAAAYNPPTEWWWFPLNTAKPRLKEGDVDTDFIGHVRYAQDVIWFGAGGNIHRDGEYGPETARRIGDVQRTFGLDDDEILGPKTWGALDYIVARIINPAPTPGPTPPASGITAVSPVLYYVQPGDSPWRAGARVYGSGAMGATLLPLTAFGVPHVHIPIPQVKGLATTVRPGEGVDRILRRFGVAPTGKSRTMFYDYNGGTARTLHPGDVVHVPQEFA